MKIESEIDYYIDGSAIDDFYSGKSSKAYDFLGCHYIKEANQYRFCVWAPNAKSISVVGDFNNWDETACPMSTYKGLWVAFSDAVKPGDNYKFSVHGEDDTKILKADPYAFYSEIPPNTASRVWGFPKYEWGDDEYLKDRAAKNIQNSPVSIYELHIESWHTDEDGRSLTYRTMADKLVDYVTDMGYTHVEFMPVNEYPFDGSWGYQVTGFFAITSRFGTPEDFMFMIDSLHRAGIGVIVDWVPAHFPKDEHGLAHFDGSWLYEHQNPLRREHPQWGTYEFNYGRPEVKCFLISSARLLIDVYHIDGLRVDAVSSVLYLDYGRDGPFVKNKDGGNVDYDAVAFLQSMNETLLGDNAGIMTIAEEATSFPFVTGPPYDGGLGFTFKWNMGFMHDTLDFMSIDSYFRHGAHEKLTFAMHYAFSENFILPYSHDEVVHGKKSMIEKMFGDYDVKFASLRLLFGYLYGHPGKKLMFMGDEFAQFIEWDYKKELDWFLLDYDSHRGMQNFVKALNHMYKENPALYEIDHSWDGFEWLTVDDKSNSVFAFMRKCEDEYIVCIYNFLPYTHEKYDVALPMSGSLELLLTSDEKEYYGSGEIVEKKIFTKNAKFNGRPNRATFRLPATSALFYKYIAEEVKDSVTNEITEEVADDEVKKSVDKKGE